MTSGSGAAKGTVAFLDELAVLGYNKAHPTSACGRYPGGTASGVDIAVMNVTGRRSRARSRPWPPPSAAIWHGERPSRPARRRPALDRYRHRDHDR